jgi:predicted transcriptional regulator
MREAIDQYLKREEAEAKFVEEARQALADYRATGLHITHEEVEGWFEKIARGEDAELPAPHK